MTLPRLLDDEHCSAALRQLLTNAPDVPAMPAELNRQLSVYAAQLVAGTAAATALGATSAQAMTQGSLLSNATAAYVGAHWATKVVLATALFTSVTGLGYVVSAPLVSGRQVSPVATQAPSLPAPTPVEKRVETTPSAVPVEPSDVVRKQAAARTVHQKTPQPGGEPSLAREAKMLELARGALEGNPAQALEIAEEHARLFPQAQLLAEREFIAIEALLRLGRRDAAIKRAAPRLTEAPGSLYAKRLRQLLGSDGTNP